MSAPTVVVVDPYSSGSLLAPALREAGFSPVAVTTGARPPEIYRSSYRPSDFDARLVCEQVTPDLLESLRAMSPVAVLAGAETGVELGDLLAGELAPNLANAPALASARRHKGDMVAAVASGGLATIRTTCAREADQVARWLADEGMAGPDLVLKPARSAGTDGVTFVPGGRGWRDAFDRLIGARNRLGAVNDEVVVQEHVTGVEFVVNTFSHDGRHTVTDVSRYGKVRNGPHMAVYESVEYLPPDHPGTAELTSYVRRVLDCLGIRFGPAHTEVMVTDRGPVLIETGARLAGGGMPESARLATGDNAVDRLVRRLRGDHDIPAGYALERTVLVAFLVVPSSGRIRNASAYQAIGKLPSCSYLQVAVEDGDLVESSSDLFGSLDHGFAVLAHRDPDQVHADHAEIRRIEAGIVIEDVPR